MMEQFFLYFGGQALTGVGLVIDLISLQSALMECVRGGTDLFSITLDIWIIEFDF